jgi:hypothetical protein
VVLPICGLGIAMANFLRWRFLLFWSFVSYVACYSKWNLPLQQRGFTLSSFCMAKENIKKALLILGSNFQQSILIFLAHILYICKNQDQIYHILLIRFCKHVHNSGLVGLNFLLLMQLLIHVCQHYVFVFSGRLLLVANHGVVM